MKNNYLGFAEGGLTIYCGENARTNCNASLKQAAALSKSGRKGKILYINTFLSVRKMMAAARLHLPEQQKNVLVMNIDIGELANEIYMIESTIKEEKISAVIVNSWEFAHKSYLCKERATFELMRFMNDRGASLLVYSQAKAVEPGKIQRGGLGKLSGLAEEIVSLVSENEFPISETRTPIPAPRHPIPDPRPEIPGSQNEKLSNRKINDLEYARSQSGVSSGGELVLPEKEVVEERELVEV